MKSGGDVPTRPVAADSTAPAQQPAPDVEETPAAVTVGTSDSSEAPSGQSHYIDAACFHMPGAVRYSNNRGCHWISESGTEVTIYRGEDGVVVINGVGRSQADGFVPPPRSPMQLVDAAIALSNSAWNRLSDIPRILRRERDSLSDEEKTELDNELTNLLDALNLVFFIKVARRMLAKEDVDLEAVSEEIQRIRGSLNADTVSALSEEARSALCDIFNDPNVDAPSISDDLWNLICY